MARIVYKWNPESRQMEEIVNDVPSVQVHGVIQDSMPPTKNHVDGNVYESKSAFRRVYKSYGYEEVGGGPPPVRQANHSIDHRKIEAAIRHAKEVHNILWVTA